MTKTGLRHIGIYYYYYYYCCCCCRRRCRHHPCYRLYAGYYIPETNHFSRVYGAAAVLYLQFVLHVMLFHTMKYVLYFYNSTFCSVSAVPNMAVFLQCLNLFFPSMSLRYCLSELDMVPVIPIITSITCASIMRSLYFKIFSASLLITFLSRGIAAPMNMHVPCLLSRIMMSSLLLVIVLSVCTCWFHNMAILPSRLVSTDFSTWS